MTTRRLTERLHPVTQAVTQAVTPRRRMNSGFLPFCNHVTVTEKKKREKEGNGQDKLKSFKPSVTVTNAGELPERVTYIYGIGV